MSKVRQSQQASPADTLAELPHLPRKQLIELWVKHVGRPPPKAASSALLVRAVGYAVQEQQFGGLKRQELRSLRKATESCAASTNGQQGPNPRTNERPSSEGCESGLTSRRKLAPNAGRIALRLGTRLVREWQGKSHTVDVRADGLSWNGTVYRSLSAVALAITGARWSGNRFFRL